MFELLLKVEPQLFARGSLELDGSWSLYLVTLVIVAVLVAGLSGYAGGASRLRARQRWFLAGLRFALLALVALLLLRPTLVVPVRERETGSVVVLVDDSRSMTIADRAGETRARQLERLLKPDGGVLASALEGRFATRYFRFSERLAPWDRRLPLRFDGSRTDLEGALENLVRQPRLPPLVAVVVVSDGGVDDGQVSSQILRSLRAAGVTVYTVGVGQVHERDVELTGVRIPERVLEGDRAGFEIDVSHRGVAGRGVRLVVEDDGAIVLERRIDLSTDRGRERVRTTLTFDESGAHDLAFRVEQLEGEAVTANNVLYRTLQVHDEQVDVLHVEGEPRFEVKFLRRAVSDDEVLRLVSLIRTAENKFYRIGVEHPQELEAGFPTSREPLFAYRVLILGSVRAADLSLEQQMLIGDFVGRRGGGLLLLGGDQAFSEGGYRDSVLAGLLPVVLPPADPGYRTRVTVRPTAVGLEHPALQIATADQLLRRWHTLPPLTVVNPITTAKPGATVLLEANDASGRNLAILAVHRYGRGAVATFPVRDSWRWQMHGDIPVEDQTHERLWRQILRWLARPAGGRLRVRVWPEQATPGQVVTLDAEILDPAFEPLADARAELVITTPSGDIDRQPVTPTVQGRGFYRARFAVAETGRYDLDLRLEASNRTIINEPAFVNVTADGREFHESDLNRDLLTRIAESTGGRYFPVADARQLPDAIDDLLEQRISRQRIPLWDAPLWLLALLLLLSLEWLYRRRLRLP